jgi:hypothetical protein
LDVLHLSRIGFVLELLNADQLNLNRLYLQLGVLTDQEPFEWLREAAVNRADLAAKFEFGDLLTRRCCQWIGADQEWLRLVFAAELRVDSRVWNFAVMLGLPLNGPFTKTSKIDRDRNLVDDWKINTHVGINQLLLFGFPQSKAEFYGFGWTELPWYRVYYLVLHEVDTLVSG